MLFSRNSSALSRNNDIQRIYLTSIGCIFLQAYISYYIQYPGLLSSSAGIEPISRIFPHVFPKLNDVLIDYELDLDSCVELLQLFGISLAMLVTCGFHHGIFYLLLSLVYGILVTLGQTFYSFQWDILLIEVGIATSISLAPWSSSSSLASKHSFSSLPIRLVLFKLMLMSGIVKLQANCPTWNQLTALEYHFATQCLPNPLSWFVHQLHPFLLRLGVAVTFLIEIPFAILIILPLNEMRRLGAWFQILLQLLIILTGNYNFFNILTTTLCLVCFIEEDWIYLIHKRWWRFLQRIVTLGFVAWCSYCMFEIYVHNSELGIRLIISFKDLEAIINIFIPISINPLLLFQVISTLAALSNTKNISSFLKIFTRSFICTIWIGVLAVPMLTLTPELQNNGFIGSRSYIMPIYDYLQQYHVSNGYGLFRRMTGVGQTSSSKSIGYANLPPSIVARPEIVLKGRFQSSTSKWYDIDFLHKPTNTKLCPTQIAPHQPRLDWQMWFAALGHFQHNPWLIHFLYKLLQGCQPVIDLIDTKLFHNDTLQQVKATLWYYDFTRIDTSWNKKIPNVFILKQGLFKIPNQYWIRKFQRNYLPIILELNSTKVVSYLQSMGYITSNEAGSNTCVVGSERCSRLVSKDYLNLQICRFTLWVRDHFLALILVSFFVCWIGSALFLSQLNKIPKTGAKSKMKYE